MKPLDRQFNVAVLHLAGMLHPTGFNVSDVAPNTLAEVNESIASGRLTVWSGASEATIFGDREVNYAFRAWHDWTHWRGQRPFTRDGEVATARDQQQHIRLVYGNGKISKRMQALVWAEVVGQLEYQELWGNFPTDQRAFVEAYLRDPGAAVKGVF